MEELQDDRLGSQSTKTHARTHYTFLPISMQIRNARSDDLEQIVRIYNQAVKEGNCTADTELQTTAERKGWFAVHSAAQYPVCVMADEETIGAWYSLSAYRPGRAALQNVAEISYYVDRNLRNRGVGQQLLDHALQKAATLGLHHLFAILLDSNRVSVQLLKKNGFDQWGHLPDIAEFPDRTCGQFIYGRKIG